MKQTITVDVRTCARCGADHHALAFGKFARSPTGSPSHWALCPTTAEPVFLSIREEPIEMVPCPCCAGTAHIGVVFEPSAEGVYTVHVPGLPGCVAHGATREEARLHIQHAVLLRLDQFAGEREASAKVLDQIAIDAANAAAVIRAGRDEAITANLGRKSGTEPG